MLDRKLKIIFFNKQSFLLLPIFFFLWYSITSFYGYIANENDLPNYTGKLSILDSGKQNSNRNSYLTLKLDTEPLKLFKLRSLNKSNNFKNYFFSKLRDGDLITIFTEPSIYNINNVGNVVKIVKDKKIIINFYRVEKSVSFYLFVVVFVLFLLFFFVYFFKIRKKILLSNL